MGLLSQPRAWFMGFFAAVGMAMLTFAVWLVGTPEASAQDGPITIVTIGDSYISGFGLSRGDSFPAALQAALSADGHPATVVNTMFHETSDSGLRWLTKSDGGHEVLAQSSSEGAIIELGQNDCSYFKIAQTRANLDQIFGLFAAQKIPVLVVGTAAYPPCGPPYVAAFAAIFPDLAAKYGDLLYPDFKTGVTGHPELMQSDQDHPNAAGEAIVVANMLPVVETLVARVGAQ